MKKQPYFYPEKNTNNHRFLTEKTWFLPLLLAATFAAGLLIASSFSGRSSHSFLCSLTGAPVVEKTPATPKQLLAILHYATTRTTPQQSRAEIQVTFDVLKFKAPCNFLVFGLGHDSLMWTSFNPHGTTIFLEEDPRWVHTTLHHYPMLRAHIVKYKTHLSQADELLATYKREPDCLNPNLQLKDNKHCRLALNMLPKEVYDKEWDVIMIDAPRGYFPEAPGRMGAIYSAAVMSRARTKPGVTHVFLHDVNRKVEKVYAKEFLCRKYLVNSVGRLWHFEIPPGTNKSHSDQNFSFC